MSLLTKAINGLDSIVDVENVRSKSSMAIVGIMKGKGQAAPMTTKIKGAPIQRQPRCSNHNRSIRRCNAA